MDAPRARVLVDCGLYQGLKPLRLRNWEPFPVEPASIDAVVLTHAHLDHSGYLPALHRQGFRGRVYASPGTVDLSGIVLRDAGRLQEEEAAYANRKGYSKHHPALSLFTEEDADAVLGRFRTAGFGAPLPVADGVQATLRPAGHILGAATVTLELEGGPRLGFSGDLGRPNHPLLQPPAPLPAVDALLVESTYGDRRHAGLADVDLFAKAIARTAGRGGVVVIPAFAVDRTEVVLFALRRLVEEKRIPQVPIHVDSPMALSALRVYRQAIAVGSPEIRPELHGREGLFDAGLLSEAHSVEESRAINEVEGPAIIVSASGMATGGRVLHHLRRRLPNERNSVILVGYQADGTRGARLLAGEKTLKMHGTQVPVRAEVVDVSAFSVHADRDELLAWLGGFERAPRDCFVVHGEQSASQALAQAISRELGWRASVPEPGGEARIGAQGAGR